MASSSSSSGPGLNDEARYRIEASRYLKNHECEHNFRRFLTDGLSSKNHQIQAPGDPEALRNLHFFDTDICVIDVTDNDNINLPRRLVAPQPWREFLDEIFAENNRPPNYRAILVENISQEAIGYLGAKFGLPMGFFFEHFWNVTESEFLRRMQQVSSDRSHVFGRLDTFIRVKSPKMMEVILRENGVKREDSYWKQLWSWKLSNQFSLRKIIQRFEDAAVHTYKYARYQGIKMPRYLQRFPCTSRESLYNSTPKDLPKDRKNTWAYKSTTSFCRLASQDGKVTELFLFDAFPEVASSVPLDLVTQLDNYDRAINHPSSLKVFEALLTSDSSAIKREGSASIKVEDLVTLDLFKLILSQWRVFLRLLDEQTQHIPVPDLELTYSRDYEFLTEVFQNARELQECTDKIPDLIRLRPVTPAFDYNFEPVLRSLKADAQFIKCKSFDIRDRIERRFKAYVDTNSIHETKNVKRLSLLATLFLPATLPTGLLSMGSRLVDLKELLWDYGALVLFGGALVWLFLQFAHPEVGKQRFSKLTKTFFMFIICALMVGFWAGVWLPLSLAGRILLFTIVPLTGIVIAIACIKRLEVLYSGTAR